MIDIHAHPTAIADYLERDPDLRRAIREVFGFPDPSQPMATFLAALDDAGIDRAVLLPIDCTTAHGCRVCSNELIAEIVDQHPRFIGFASVDPSLPDAPEALEHAVREYGLAGLKLDPSLQQFGIDDTRTAYPVYAKCVELRIPVLMHCGLSWAPRGESYRGQPLPLERVVHAFPELRIVIAHCGFPWIEEALLLALKYPNVYLDTAVLSGTTTSEALRHALADTIGLDVVRRSLHHKLLLGSNTPRQRPKRGVAAVRDLGLEPWLEQRILHDNAAALLGLGESRP